MFDRLAKLFSKIFFSNLRPKHEIKAQARNTMDEYTGEHAESMYVESFAAF
jgi:hypothetical protein